MRRRSGERGGRILALVLAGLCWCGTASAVAVFDDEAAWRAAIGGSPDFLEDFESFTSDLAWGATPLDVGHFTLSADSVIGDRGQLIDVVPLADVGGSVHTTNRGVAFVDGDGVSVFFRFPTSVVAWGFEYSGAATGEGLGVEFSTTSSLETSTELAQSDGFFGFVLGPGEGVVRSVRLHALRSDGNPESGERFTFDNVVGQLGETGPSPVPVPAAWLLLSTGLAGLALLQRKSAGARRPPSGSRPRA